MQFGDQELELQEPPRYDVDEEFIDQKNPLEFNEVYQIPISQIPELQFEIKYGFAEQGKVYTKSDLITGDEIERNEKNDLQNGLTLHKYTDIMWEKLQKIPKGSTTLTYPSWPNVVTKLKKRIIEIKNTPGLELYFDEKEKSAKVKKIESDISETLVSPDEMTQFKKNIEKQQDSAELVVQKKIKEAMMDVSKSKVRKEAQRDLQDLSIQIENATKEAERFMNPPRSSVNIIYNENVEKINQQYIDQGVIYRANVILRHIISLVKYTKYSINFFGNNNEKLEVALGDARDVVQRMTAQSGIERLYSLFDLIGIARIVLPPKEQIFQKKIMEPSTPSPELRVEQSKLTSAGTGRS